MFPDGDRLIRRWDPSAIGRRATFVFYLLLGGSIAAAIRSAGVLMVFTYLVAPALAIRILGVERGAGSVAVVTAAACGVFGLWGSYRWDLPSGSAIVAAIRSAGVLMVFTYLVAPALAIRLIGLERAAGAIAVGTAAACGVLGLWGSYQWDLPSGSSIVAVFGAWLAVTALVASLGRRTGVSD